jgi:anthranilate phosphoribosyltransferase
MGLREQLRHLLAEEPVARPELLTILTDRLKTEASLSWHDTAQAIRLLVEGTAPAIDRLAFLRELTPGRANGEMLAAAAGVLRSLAPKIPFESEIIFDCCGTGGDRLGLFNFSTLAGIVVAAAGVPVAKHGNRAITSGCGSADLLAALGVEIESGPEAAAASLKAHGIAFLFAPFYHQATRNVQPLRIDLAREGVATLFNLLGPLTNPAAPTHQFVGVFHPGFLWPMAEALLQLGCQRALVVSGSDGAGNWMDELSPCGETKAVELIAGRIEERTVELGELGLEPISLEELKGGNAARNAELAEAILGGELSPRGDAVCLNAGAGLYLTGRSEGIRGGVDLARDLIQSGAAADRLRSWAGESSLRA